MITYLVSFLWGTTDASSAGSGAWEVTFAAGTDLTTMEGRATATRRIQHAIATDITATIIARRLTYMLLSGPIVVAVTAIEAKEGTSK